MMGVLPVGEPPPTSWRKPWHGVPVPAWRYFRETTSTQDVARAWAEAGAWEGCLVVAERQTQGRGREGRRWWSHPKSSLTFSLVLRPLPQEAPYLGHYAGWAAVAVCRVLEGLGLDPRIKWPNDILLAGRKVGGILIEAFWQGSSLPDFVVVGIGMNLGKEAVPPSEMLDFPATALEFHLHRPVHPPEMLVRLWLELTRWRPQVGRRILLTAWEARLAYWGQSVLIGEGASQQEGRILGLTVDGRLRVRLASGEERIFTTATHLRPVDERGAKE